MSTMETMRVTGSKDFPGAKLLEQENGKALVMYDSQNDMWQGLAFYDGWLEPLEALSFDSICLEFRIFLHGKYGFMNVD